jgi:hypothetical protein
VKVLAFILALVLGTALQLGGTFLIIEASPRHSDGAVILAASSLVVLIFGPLVLGSVSAQWDVRASEGGRTYFRRAIWVVLGLEVLAAIAVVLYAVIVRAAAWLPVMFIAGGALITVLALVAGRLLRRYEETHPRPEPAWEPISRREIRKKILIVAVTFVAALVVGLVVFGVLLNNESHRSSETATQISYAFQFAAIGAAMANIIVAIPLNRRVRDIVGRDLGVVRTVAKAVLSKKKVELGPSEEVAAARYATIVPTILGFMLGYFTLLFIGLIIQQVRFMFEPRIAAFGVGFTVFLVAVLIFAYPYYVVRIRRARRYARDHPALLESDDEPVTS